MRGIITPAGQVIKPLSVLSQNHIVPFMSSQRIEKVSFQKTVRLNAATLRGGWSTESRDCGSLRLCRRRRQPSGQLRRWLDMIWASRSAWASICDPCLARGLWPRAQCMSNADVCQQCEIQNRSFSVERSRSQRGWLPDVPRAALEPVLSPHRTSHRNVQSCEGREADQVG